MKRTIELSNGVVSSDEKEYIVEIIPDLKKQFRQRKNYFEYYYDSLEVDLTLEQIEKLSNEFTIEIGFSHLKIQQ